MADKLKTIKIRNKAKNDNGGSSSIDEPVTTPASSDSLLSEPNSENSITPVSSPNSKDNNSSSAPSSPASSSSAPNSEKRKSLFLRSLDYLRGANEDEKQLEELRKLDKATLNDDAMQAYLQLKTPAADTGPVENLDRQHALREIIDSERRYVEFLTYIAPFYREVLLKSNQSPVSSPTKKSLFSALSRGISKLRAGANTSILNPEIAAKLFPHSLDQLIATHMEFLQVVEARFNLYKEGGQMDELCIGDVFIDFSSRFKIHVEYLTEYKKSMVHYKAIIEKSKVFEEWINGQKTKTKGQDLASLLTMPIQRLPRYVLLIKAIYKHTPANHADYKSLIESDEIMCEYCEKINFRSFKTQSQLH